MENDDFALSCPTPILNYDTIQLAHGAGGRLSAELIEKVFLPCFENEILLKLEDQAQLEKPNGRIAFTTDSFVVSPIFFPGGNIGDLAVNGTVNDICMSGAIPLYLSVGFIIEEGFEVSELCRIVDSMGKAAKTAGVRIVTGDTKVVNRGSCDKIFINTSGIGVIPNDINLGAGYIKPGDKVILSGTIADHGMSVMTARDGLSFESRINSDTAGLNYLVRDMFKVSKKIHAMRDPTRGGVAAILNEFARSSNTGIRLFEETIPVSDEVKGACELLGLDPLYVANEGKLIAITASEDAGKIVEKMQCNDLGKKACIIGEVTDENAGKVTLRNIYGIERILDMPIGEQLPRIC
ncbi:MAG: hydrogenase expression/formation protein HypE [Calditrichaceae bacterium]|nr:hydrogenase expression/formation protein HypE [Calditrichaceae bacterium]MBN2709901.1 hydrogenase expression/formation protein HypE [Calditrichaceae bacterium]RQV92704.1 MAG: hydrogenase expression/formation protein HypE [Calditrichota bacterium]